MDQNANPQRNVLIVHLAALLFLLGRPALAEDMGGMHCPMCAFGWVGMALCVVLLVAIVAALVALTIFLVRKSRHH